MRANRTKSQSSERKRLTLAAPATREILVSGDSKPHPFGINISGTGADVRRYR